MTWEKSWLCLKPTYYALTQHGYVRQILKQFKSITLGCKNRNIENTYLSVVSHCVVTHANQVFWQNLGMMGHFSWLGARKKITRSVSRENSQTWHYPLHTIKFILETDILFLCWNSQSFHLHTGGVLRFIASYRLAISLSISISYL